MKYVVLLGMAMLMLSGCSSIYQKVGPQVAKAVTRYCTEPYEARQFLRAQVNGMVQPHEVAVHCAGDPESFSGDKEPTANE